MLKNNSLPVVVLVQLIIFQFFGFESHGTFDHYTQKTQNIFAFKIK
jgi:hypothetical protein